MMNVHFVDELFIVYDILSPTKLGSAPTLRAKLWVDDIHVTVPIDIRLASCGPPSWTSFWKKHSVSPSGPLLKSPKSNQIFDRTVLSAPPPVSSDEKACSTKAHREPSP